MEKKEIKTKVDTKVKASVKSKTNTKVKVSAKPDVVKSKADAKSRSNNKERTRTKHDVTKIYATGKRKTSIAKVWMMNKGAGKITVNGKNLTEYFKRPLHKIIINQPLKMVKVEGMYDIECKVLGGGLSGQAGAIKHGVSKALNQISEEFHQILRSGGFLTRDSRKVERKKYGQPKARKKFQFSKR